jgi:integrase
MKAQKAAKVAETKDGFEVVAREWYLSRKTAHRTKTICGQVFRYAIATGRAERDPAADLRDALKPYKEGHLPAIIDPKELGPLLKAIDTLKGTHVVRCALKLTPMLMARPGELSATFHKYGNVL